MDGYLTGPSWLARIIFVSEKLVHMYMEAPPIFDSYKLVSCDLMAAGRWYSPSSHITLFSTARERERELATCHLPLFTLGTFLSFSCLRNDFALLLLLLLLLPTFPPCLDNLILKFSVEEEREPLFWQYKSGRTGVKREEREKASQQASTFLPCPVINEPHLARMYQCTTGF